MRIKIESIKQNASQRPEGYVDDVMSHGQVIGEYLQIDPNAYRELQIKYSTQMVVSGCCGQSASASLKMPALRRQMKNAATAVAKAANAAIHGNKVMASDELVEKRMNVCKSCEFLKGNRCTKCGCFYEWKIKLETEKCPMGFW